MLDSHLQLFHLQVMLPQHQAPYDETYKVVYSDNIMTQMRLYNISVNQIHPPSFVSIICDNEVTTFHEIVMNQNDRNNFIYATEIQYHESYEFWSVVLQQSTCSTM